MQEKTYTTFQIADVCGVRPTTIIKWINQGKMNAYTTPGGHRRVCHSDLLKFMQEYRLPIPEGLAAGRKRILIVEDEPAIGQLFKRAIAKSLKGVEVDWTKDGIEALLVLGNNPPDLVILDVVMPVVDGARVLSTLRNDPRTKKVKVIGITGKKLPPEKLKFMQTHTDAFYYKPFDMNELAGKIMSLLGILRSSPTYVGAL